MVPEYAVDSHSEFAANASLKIFNGSRIPTSNSNNPQIFKLNGKRGRLKSKLSGHFHRNVAIRSFVNGNEEDDIKFTRKSHEDNDGYQESTTHHKFRFWRNKKNSKKLYIDLLEDRKSDYCSITSSRSTKVDSETVCASSSSDNTQKFNPKDYEESVIFKRLPRHHFRRWLNEAAAEEGSSSILEIRQSKVTTRIIKARHAISMAAEKTASIASVRIQAQAIAFIAAVTAAAFARVRAAERDPCASHGSIANATMYATQEVARALVDSKTTEDDITKLNDIFQEHFKFKGPGYFKTLRPFCIKNSNKHSAAYRMYHKMKGIPNPPIGADPLEYYLQRATEREVKRQKIEGASVMKNDEVEKHEKSNASDEQSEKSVLTRVSTAKSAFWSFIGMEAESTKKMEDDNASQTCSQTEGAMPRCFLQEISGKPPGENEKSEGDDASIKSSRSVFWSYISGKV